MCRLLPASWTPTFLALWICRDRKGFVLCRSPPTVANRSYLFEQCFVCCHRQCLFPEKMIDQSIKTFDIRGERFAMSRGENSPSSTSTASELFRGSRASNLTTTRHRISACARMLIGPALAFSCPTRCWSSVDAEGVNFLSAFRSSDASTAVLIDTRAALDGMAQRKWSAVT